MNIKLKGKIQQIEECPECGYDEYYIYTVVSGKQAYFTKFNGEEGDNSQLHETLKYKDQITVYCGNCHIKLGTIIQQELEEA